MACRVELMAESFAWFDMRCSTKNTFLHVISDEEQMARRPRRSASMPASCHQESPGALSRYGSKCSAASTASTRTPSVCSPAESDEECSVVGSMSSMSPMPSEAAQLDQAGRRKERTRLPGRKRPGKPARPSQALRHLYREVANELIKEALADPAAYWAKEELTLPPALGQNAWLVGKLRRRIEICLQQAEQGLHQPVDDDCFEA